MTPNASLTIKLPLEEKSGARFHRAGIASLLTGTKGWPAIISLEAFAGAPAEYYRYFHDNTQCSGEAGVGEHIGRDAWTEGGIG